MEIVKGKHRPITVFICEDWIGYMPNQYFEELKKMIKNGELDD